MKKIIISPLLLFVLVLACGCSSPKPKSILSDDVREYAQENAQAYIVQPDETIREIPNEYGDLTTDIISDMSRANEDDIKTIYDELLGKDAFYGTGIVFDTFSFYDAGSDIYSFTGQFRVNDYNSNPRVYYPIDVTGKIELLANNKYRLYDYEMRCSTVSEYNGPRDPDHG